MFCNKERIKISSFSLFFLAEDGENRLLVADGSACWRCCRLSVVFAGKCRDVFYFLYKSKKLCTKNIWNSAGFQKPFVVYAENVEETLSKFSILSRKTYLCKINRTNRL